LLIFGLLTTFTLIIVNVVWLSSVHVVGVNTIPPELNHICIELDLKQRTIRCTHLIAQSMPQATPV